MTEEQVEEGGDGEEKGGVEKEKQRTNASMKKKAKGGRI